MREHMGISEYSPPSQESREAAKNLICEIVAASAGELRGKVRLSKAFYFAHLYYWRDQTRTLTDYPIIHLPNGPGVEALDELLDDMQRNSVIRVRQEPMGPYQENVYELLRPITLDSSNSRHRAVEAAVKHIAERTAAELSQETHEFSRSWGATTNGQPLNVYVDILSDTEYTNLLRGLRTVEELVDSVFA